MAFDVNRNIVDDWLNNIFRGLEVLDFDPLAEIYRRIDFDDFDDDADFNEDADDYDDDEDEYGGERRRKRRKARHHNRPEWTPLQRRRVAGDSPPAKATFMTNILDNPAGATEKQLEIFRKHFRAPVEVVQALVEEMKESGDFEDKSDRRGKRGAPGHRLDLYVACCLRILATGNSLFEEELWSGISAQSLHAFLGEFIERYKVDTLNVAEVKERFGLNDLELDQAGKRRLTSRVTSARGAAQPYAPLFETLQHLIESKRCFSPDAIQKSMVATLGQTRSIRGEFKRMAKVLAGVDGVANRAEALKTAWNVTVDPK